MFIRACVHARTPHAWRILRSHDFDTITCVRRCERAVMFFVTSLCFGRYASGACVCVHPSGAWISCTRRVHTCTCMCAHSPLSGTHMCERVHVHVSAPCGCVISFSKRTLNKTHKMIKTLKIENLGPEFLKIVKKVENQQILEKLGKSKFFLKSGNLLFFFEKRHTCT